MTNAEPMILCDNLVKIYKTTDIEVVALQGLDLEIARGEFMAIIGNSGSGKSTLLNMLGGLDRPSAGTLLVDGQNLLKMNDLQLCEYKRKTVGFVWQNNARNLIPYLTAVENIELPMIIEKSPVKRRERALELLDMVGLSHRRKNRLRELSGGEQQRVAIAIALANTPKLLLADEPTGAVDSKTSANILELLKNLNRTLGITVVIVTHDRKLAGQVDRVVNIRDGRTSSEFLRRSYKADMENLGRLDTNAPVPGPEGDSHEEFVVLDRVGRMQVPKEYLESVGLAGKGRLHYRYEGNKLVLSPMEEETSSS